ncbi:Serine-threonine/tyrosine-protein kinase [Theobroma cacao]|nr:Serine-threonine/tyrosine-protein kinase [Theobroma cacao]
MEFMDMHMNKLSGNLVPEIDIAFPNLQVFVIGDNRFTGTIPRSIANISSLQQFDIYSNGFSGSVPDNLGNLNNLQLLVLDYNNLGSGKAGDLDFISSLSNYSLLETLVIHKNRFGGRLPDSIANLSIRLRVLYMGENQITGSLPEGIGNLVNLNDINMGNLFLTGNIPVSMGKLQNLEGLSLPSNHLSGKIPSSVGNLSRLSKLDLSNNNFEGRILQSLANCDRMEQLDLSQNKLNGSIPNQLFGAFKSLFYLNLSHNSFTGLLPLDLGNLKNLVQLFLDNNKFFGEIPCNLGQSSGLRILYMQGNSFQGSIPTSFGSLRSLEILDFSSNNLSGNIPLELETLRFLVSLNLSFNQLEGEVPKQGVFKNVSGFSFMGNKKLCGGILQLELPKCFDKEPKKRANVLSTKVITMIILSVLIASFLAVFLVNLCWKRRSRMELNPVALLGDGYLRVSYKELLQATGSFASSNLFGGGAFGSVYKGVLHQQEKPVAVKVLNLQNHRVAQSFMAECKVLRKVRHRNIVEVITSCSSIDYRGNDFKALVFEFMPNGSLESWLHEHSESKYLNFVQRLEIAIDVANAIDYLHHDCETMIVHRDLKPTIVLLDDEMVAHVSDFGLSRLVSSHSRNMGMGDTNSSLIKGTIGYVAPEYGMGGVASPEGDIYSYGILLLEMITGRRPTDGMFHNGLSLHSFCKMALPEQFKEIIDFRLLEQMGEDMERISRQQEAKILECLVSFTKIGVACSAEVPAERMRIKDAITGLEATKARLIHRTGHM